MCSRTKTACLEHSCRHGSCPYLSCWRPPAEICGRRRPSLCGCPAVATQDCCPNQVCASWHHSCDSTRCRADTRELSARATQVPAASVLAREALPGQDLHSVQPRCWTAQSAGRRLPADLQCGGLGAPAVASCARFCHTHAELAPMTGACLRCELHRRQAKRMFC